jgi:hypothetical protein
MALVLCLLLMTTLCLVGGAALSVSGLNQKIVHNGAKQVQSFYLAEAGKELALSYLKEDPLWRGTVGAVTSGFSGGLPVGEQEGTFHVVIWDCTDDGNGQCNTLIPAGHVRVESEGIWLDACHHSSCIIRIRSYSGSVPAFPPAAVVSSGTMTGALVTLDEMGSEDSTLIYAGSALPATDKKVLTALADSVFSSLDNNLFDFALGDVGGFWRDAPGDTQPYIICVNGDVSITGDRQLKGVIFVAGSQVSLEGESGIQGVLYAPNATSVTISNTGASGRIAVRGQLITGASGVVCTGNSVAIQLVEDYADAFNSCIGSEWCAEVLPGGWSSF